jgi:hypothetical protein
MRGTGTGASMMKRIAAPMVGGMISSTVLAAGGDPGRVYSLWKERTLRLWPVLVPTPTCGGDRSRECKYPQHLVVLRPPPCAHTRARVIVVDKRQQQHAIYSFLEGTEFISRANGAITSGAAIASGRQSASP